MHRLSGVVVAMSAFALSACFPPTLNQLVPNGGPERTVVMVEGDQMLYTQVVWDAGLPGERVIPGALLGGFMFSVPVDAGEGIHPVALRNDQGTSGTVDFTVTPPLPYPPARLDRVSIIYARFDPGTIRPILYVQGANVDVGSVVRVDGAEMPTIAHRAVKPLLFGADPNVLGYPIYHYVGLVSVVDPQPLGSTIEIEIRDLEGRASPRIEYTLPASADEMDRDGDNLLDVWELEGYDADGDGVVDVDLPGLGANVGRPDVFVEIDVMESLDNPPLATAPGAPGTFDTLKASYRLAAIVNPNGLEGVNLIIDSSGTVPVHQELAFDEGAGIPAGTTEFATLKAANFDDATRGRIYHYGIWGNMRPNETSGKSDKDPSGFEGGDDFLIAFDDFPASYQTLRSQAATLMHELGHNLGQKHGGLGNLTRNPNHWSVMSYAWQLRSAWSDETRRLYTTCTPLYWNSAAALEPNGAPPASSSAIAGYSHGMGPKIVENDGSLDETIGVCGKPVYWNDDLDTTDTDLGVDANHDGDATQTYFDLSNWRFINFRGPETNGTLP